MEDKHGELENKNLELVLNYFIYEVEEYNKTKEYKEQVFLSIRRIYIYMYLFELAYMEICNGEPFFKDEFVAWFVPTIPELYLMPDYTDSYKNNEVQLLDKEVSDLINYILENTHEIDSFDLIKMVTLSDSPWKKARDIYNNNKSSEEYVVISKKDIYQYYKNREVICSINENKKKILDRKKDIMLHDDEV